VYPWVSRDIETMLRMSGSSSATRMAFAILRSSSN
jgi:hypothetical protein